LRTTTADRAPIPPSLRRPQVSGPSTRHGGRAGSPNPATVPATDPEGFERVREQGMQLYERLLAQKDPNE